MSAGVGRLLVTRCDACRRTEQRCELIVRSGMELWVCVAWRECNAAQPSINVMVGGVGR